MPTVLQIPRCFKQLTLTLEESDLERQSTFDESPISSGSKYSAHSEYCYTVETAPSKSPSFILTSHHIYYWCIRHFRVLLTSYFFLFFNLLCLIYSIYWFLVQTQKTPDEHLIFNPAHRLIYLFFYKPEIYSRFSWPFIDLLFLSCCYHSAPTLHLHLHPPPPHSICSHIFTSFLHSPLFWMVNPKHWDSSSSALPPPPPHSFILPPTHCHAESSTLQRRT